jgi:hypothetical protein
MEVTAEPGLPRPANTNRPGLMGFGAEVYLAALVLVILGAATFLFFLLPRKEAKPLQTEYQAVLLDNGSAYFGKTVSITKDFLTLSDVYYVQTRTNPDTKQVSNVLIRRGKEWHGPDRMVINRQHLVFMEPVAPDSTVAHLIQQSKAQ